MEIINDVIGKNGLIFAFLLVGVIMLLSAWISKTFTQKRIPAVAIAVIIGLALAFFGDKKGISDVTIFAGMALLGGSMLRDFAVVATAMGADISKIKQAGLAGTISLFVGVFVSFFVGVVIAISLGYSDAESIATIGAGACTYIVGPVTGSALGASSEVIAISVATGIVKTIFLTIATPIDCQKDKIGQPTFGNGLWRIIGNNQWCSSWSCRYRRKVGALWSTNGHIFHRIRMPVVSVNILLIP